MGTTSEVLKLNLGCGVNLKEGYVNVDKYGTPDFLWDLEEFPWPWDDSSVDEITLDNVLEHIGQTNDVFLKVMQELYRICKPQAFISIVVPHPRHCNFINDPTHVRSITIDGLRLFSKKNNLEWQAKNGANSPYALHLNVDFEIVKEAYVLEEPWKGHFEAGKITKEQVGQAIQQYNSVVRDILIVLKVIKE
ncbi:MAG: hypothetical protein JW938_00535 [Candidatus Omnitrophica bacterium]|nr:hypothetical protein [Candidatus Omnitrophota bacterium]